MGEGEHRRRRIRSNRGTTAAAAEAPPAVPPVREPVEPPAEAPVASRPAAERPTPAGGRLGLRAMFGGARPAPPPTPAPPAPSAPAGSGDRPGRPPARPGIERMPPVDREPIDAHAVTSGAEDHERGLRGLIGGGASQVSVTAAMRARDAARPSAQEIAAAEASLTIVHRGWVPRDP